MCAARFCFSPCLNLALEFKKCCLPHIFKTLRRVQQKDKLISKCFALLFNHFTFSKPSLKDNYLMNVGIFRTSGVFKLTLLKWWWASKPIEWLSSWFLKEIGLFLFHLTARKCGSLTWWRVKAALDVVEKASGERDASVAVVPPWRLLVAAPGLRRLRLLPLRPAPPLTPAALVCYHAVHRSRPLTPATNERDTGSSDCTFGNNSQSKCKQFHPSCLLVT